MSGSLSPASPWCPHSHTQFGYSSGKHASCRLCSQNQEISFLGTHPSSFPLKADTISFFCVPTMAMVPRKGADFLLFT